MADTLEMTLPDGSRIYVEATEGDAPLERGGLGDAVQRVAKPFDEALGTLRQIADSLQATLKMAADPPSAVTVQFGLKFDAEYGVVVAKGSVGANLQITMEWRKA